MGQGKSTSGNWILRESFKDKSKAPPAGWLKCSQNVEAVTNEIALACSDTLCFVDTCGMDDPSSNRSDDKIMIGNQLTTNQQKSSIQCYCF
jgi:hypothetical protein